MSDTRGPIQLGATFGGLKVLSLVAGVAGIAAAAAGAFAAKQTFFEAYLFAFMFWGGIAMGSFAVLMLHHLTGGGWGFSIQRIAESGARTLPLVALLFIPLLFGLSDLYLWANPDVVANDHVLHGKAIYLNVPFFLARTVGYFVIWILLATLLTGWSKKQDENADGRLTNRMVVLSGPGLLLFVITMTFAAFDWLMSLDPHWFSTIYGLLIIVGQGLSTFAFSIIVLRALIQKTSMGEVVDTDKFHDLGKLLLAFTMLWAYMMLSQYLIIYSANLPEEITWYLARVQHGWLPVSFVLVVAHFALPFLLLLTHHSKRNTWALAAIAWFILAMRLLELYWHVRPRFHDGHASGINFHWLFVATLVGVGGLWLATFLWQLGKRPLLPVNDPRLTEALHGSH